MTTNINEVAEGVQYQDPDEQIAYSVDTTNWGGLHASPSISVAVWEIDSSGNETDAKSTVMPTGSPSTSGDVITLPVLKSLTAGLRYRIEVTFTNADDNILESYVNVRA